MITLPTLTKASLKSSELHTQIKQLTQAVNALEKSDSDISLLNALQKDIASLEKMIQTLKSVQDSILDQQASKIAQNQRSFKQFFAKDTHVFLNCNAEQLCSKWEKIVASNENNRYLSNTYRKELKTIKRLANQPYYLYRDERNELNLFNNQKDMVKFKLKRELVLS